MARHAFAKAQQGDEFAAGVRASNAGEAEAEAETYAGSWHRMAGQRFGRLQRCLEDPKHVTQSVAVALVLEPFRYLTYMFMSWSNRPRDYSKHPPLMDLTWDATSPVAWTLQYLSQILSGAAPRLQMVLGQMRCASVEEWLAKFPAQAAYIRRLTLLAIGLIEHRHVAKYRQYPWGLFTCGDTRRSLDDRRAAAEAFTAKKPCCVPFGMARDLCSAEEITADVLCEDT